MLGDVPGAEMLDTPAEALDLPSLTHSVVPAALGSYIEPGLCGSSWVAGWGRM